MLEKFLLYIKDTQSLIFNIYLFTQIVIQNGYPLHIIDAAVKGFSHLIQINKTNNTIVEQIAETVWHMLPNILSTYYSDQPGLSKQFHTENSI